MAAALADWAVRKPTDRVLDPSFGGLVFLAAARDRLLDLGAHPNEIPELLYGVDLDEDAHAASSGTAWLNSRNLLDRDFFQVSDSDLPSFDAVVGNPPYIRYQSFNGLGVRARELAAEAGVALTRLASSWAPFVVHGVSFVSHGGRYAQVLPAELLHAQYAHDVVEFLRASFGRIRIAVFDDRVFPGALEEVVLLFAEDFGADGLADVELIACTTVADVQAGLAQPLKSGTSYGQSESGGLLAQLLSARYL
jgi:adenine-specific DNA methylase